MAKVEIDVPGIGLIEAKNAASESTLRELVNLMKKGGGGGGGGSGGGSGGSGSGRGGGAADNTQKAGQAMGKLWGHSKLLIGSFSKLSDTVVETLSNFANVGDSVESAARIFNGIPIIGPMLGAAASAATAVSDAFVKASGSGASFNGSVVQMTRAAGEAGQTLDQFASFISSNGEAMVALGGTTADGAKRFGALSKALRSNASDLYGLGYSTSDLNEGIAAYATNLRILGRNENMSNRELVEGSKSYLKEMDMLAKITGQTRKEKEEERKQLMQDIKYQAFASQLSEKSQKELQLLIQSYPAELQGFVKDAVMSGTLTMEANQKQAHALGGTMNQILGIRQKLLKDERVGDNIIQGALNTTKSETQKFIASNRQAIIGNDEYAQSMQGVVAGNKIQTDGVLKARQAQDQAAAETDGMNEQMQLAKAELANFSNQFQLALANTGLIDLLMNAFRTVGTFLLENIVPIFQVFAFGVTQVGNFLIGAFQTAMSAVSGLITNVVYPAFLTLALWIDTYVKPVFQFLGEMIQTYVMPVFEYLGGLINTYVAPIFEGVGGYLNDVLIPVLAGTMGAFAAYKIAMFAKTAATWLASGGLFAAAGAAWALVSPLLVAAAPFIAIGAAVAGLIWAFKKLYDAGFSVGDVLQGMGDFFYRYLMMPLKELFFKIQSSLPGWLGGLSDEEAEIKRKQLDEEYKELDDRKLARDQRKEERKKQRSEEKEETATKAEQQGLTVEEYKLKQMDLKLKNQMNGITTKTAVGYKKVSKQEQEVIDAKSKTAKTFMDNLPKEKDYSNTLQTLGQELKAANSSIISPKDKTKSAAPSTSSVQTTITKPGETADKTATTDAQGNETQTGGGGTKTASNQTTSEEGNIFIELNNNVVQLVRLTNQQLAVQNRTNRSIQDLAGVGNLLKNV
jgi:hypothetical protein